MAIYSEADLVVPALEEIARHPNGVTTSDLQVALRQALRPTGDDLILLAGRGDDRFSQKVRNLKSHSALVRRGFATYNAGTYRITPAGLNLLTAGRGVMQSLARQGFSSGLRNQAQDREFDQIVIEEGKWDNISTRVTRRSALLRKFAVRHFADASGSIACKACGFRSEEVYGPDCKSLIEIHHLKPLFLTVGVSFRSSFRDALTSVAPLCPTCHRMVHAKSGTVMSILELQNRINRMRQPKSC